MPRMAYLNNSERQVVGLYIGSDPWSNLTCLAVDIPASLPVVSYPLFAVRYPHLAWPACSKLLAVGDSLGPAPSHREGGEWMRITALEAAAGPLAPSHSAAIPRPACLPSLPSLRLRHIAQPAAAICLTAWCGGILVPYKHW
jgi:hypothetical protein